MLHRASTVAMIAVLVGVGACSTKKKALPPPPPPPSAPLTAPTGGATGNDAGGTVGSTAIPGSVADFKQTSGGDTVLFAYDSYEVDDTAKAILGKQAEWLARYPNVKVTVEGHTDERGTREYNLALGDRRASAAKNFLTAQGVATSAHRDDQLRQGTPGRRRQRRGGLRPEPSRGDGNRQRREITPIGRPGAGRGGTIHGMTARPRVRSCKRSPGAR